MKIKSLAVAAVLAAAVLCFAVPASAEAFSFQGIWSKITAAISGKTANTGSITITSPSAGEQWLKGSKQTIKWTSTGVKNVRIRLVDMKGKEYNQAVGVKASKGFHPWTVNKTVPVGDKYRIKIVDKKNSKVFGLSGYFSIVNKIKPSITVTSPNGGENWETGKTYVITWNSSGISSGFALNLSCGTSVFEIGSAPVGANSFPWTIPTSLFKNHYSGCKVQISSGFTIGYSNDVNIVPTSISGSITPSLDASTPYEQAVAGSQDVVAGKFKFTASAENFTIKEAKFTIAGGNATAGVVNSLKLKDGSITLATVPYDAVNNNFNFTGLSVSVPVNTSKVLSAVYSLATPFTDGSTITTGKNTKISLASFKAINGSGAETTNNTAITANNLYVYKSVPTVYRVSVSGQGLNLTSGATTDLYKFTVQASAKGEISVKQIKFAVNITDGGNPGSPSLNSFKLFRGNVDITSMVAIIDSNGSNLEASTSGVDKNSSSPVYVVFNTEETIPAGQTFTYTLKANSSGFDYSDSVRTNFGKDSSPAGVLAGENPTRFYLDARATAGAVQTLNTSAFKNGAGSDAVLIWSDNSAIMHDYSNDSSPDWFNGYLIDALPLGETAISANN